MISQNFLFNKMSYRCYNDIGCIIMKLKYYIALFVSKSIYYLLRILRKNGTIVPGRIANKICPDFLKYVKLPEVVIGVSGTNGKTTVSNMIINILEQNNYTVLSNKMGANVHAGIASAIIANHGKKDIAVFEIDERSSKRVYKYIKPNYILFTNIFRDSTKRNANPEYIIDIINSSLPKTSKLIINADDLLCCKIGKHNKRIFYSIDKQKADTVKKENIVNDASICPKCYAKLKYDYIRYNHIGHAVCENCGFESRKGDYHIDSIDYNNNKINVCHKNHTNNYNIVSNSIMNIYNELAVITLFSELKFKQDDIEQGLNSTQIVETRYSKEVVNNIEIINYLAKGQNPVACSNVFEDIRKQDGNKLIILMTDDVHDNIESSENMSWIYDCDYEFLNHKSIKNIVIGGPRAKDDYLRLLLAGVSKKKIKYTSDPYDTPNHITTKGINKIFILHDVYSADQAFKIRADIKQKIVSGEI